MESAVEKNKKDAGRTGTRAGKETSRTDGPLHPLLQLQQQAGNQAIQELLRSRVVQAKLSVSQPDTADEIEANCVAEAVVDGSKAIPLKHRPAIGTEPPPGVQRTWTSSPSTGHPLPHSAREALEPVVGTSLDSVRVHTGDTAHRVASAIGAYAFTTGQDIFFARDLYQPETSAGRKLLAHEVAHTIQQRDLKLGGALAQRNGPPPSGTAPVEPLARYSQLRSAAPRDFDRLNNAARARVISQALRTGSGDSAERDRLNRESATEINVPVSRLLPPLAGVEVSWMQQAGQAALGGDTNAAGLALRDEITRRWLTTLPEVADAEVRVALIDPDGESIDQATLTFQYLDQPVITTDGTLFLSQLDPAGVDAVVASLGEQITVLKRFETLVQFTRGAIEQGRSMIQTGHMAFSADDIAAWISTLAALRERVNSFSQYDAGLAASVQTLATELGNFSNSEATPFAVEHAKFLQQHQPQQSIGEFFEEQSSSQAQRELMQSPHWYDRGLSGYSGIATFQTATAYGAADALSGFNISASRQFHQAFREGHISLEAFERGASAAVARGTIYGGLNAVLMIASFGLAGPVLGATPSLLRLALFSGAAAGLSTAGLMTASTLYTRAVDMPDSYSRAIWGQGASSSGQIATSSLLAFGIGAALGVAAHVLTRVPQPTMQQLVLASAEGRPLTPLPGVEVENLSPGVVKLSIQGEPGHVEISSNGFRTFAPAGPGRQSTLVNEGRWIQPVFPPERVLENPFLQDVRGMGTMITPNQGMAFGVTPRGYFAFAPRTRTPFLEGPLLPWQNAAPAFPVVPQNPRLLLPGPAVNSTLAPPQLPEAPSIGGADVFTKVTSFDPTLDVSTRIRISRAIALQPDLLAAPRSLDEIDSILRSAGILLQREEVSALRNVVYHSLGKPAPAAPESLEDFLQRVWNDPEARAGRVRVYSLYSGATEPNPRTQDPDEYLQNIAQVAQGRPQRSFSYIQGLEKPQFGDQISSQLQNRSLNEIGESFYVMIREGTTGEVTERVYLNVRADRATSVMREVVNHIVDNPKGFPGIEAAKITGPLGVTQRADTIVIYGKDQEAMARVLEWAQRYQTQNPDHFMANSPPMTDQVLPGVSVGSEPLPMHARGPGLSPFRERKRSFGDLRSELIENALRATKAGSGTYKEFVLRVRTNFATAGVNPDQPQHNMDPHPGP